MNVLKRLIIPRMDLTIAYILAELEELEREDSFRLRRVKKKKIKKVKVDGAGENIESIELNEEETKPEETTETDETVKPENTTEIEKTSTPQEVVSSGKLGNESVSLPDKKPIQPKEAAEMGDLIVLKPPDDKMEFGDVFVPPLGLKTMATITEVEELIEGISEIKKEKVNIKALKEIQSDDEKVQLVENDVKNDVENMETGEWFETPSKLENMAKLTENVSLYSKIEKLDDIIGGDKEADTTSEAKLYLKAGESVIDLDKQALASLYRDIDSNFYQPTVDDIFSIHDLAVQDSVSRDISILDHSLVDLESIDFSIDSKGKVVVSKLDTVQSSPVLLNQEANDSELMASNDKGNQLVAPLSRIASVKWINESKTKAEGLMSQLEDEVNSKLAEETHQLDDLEPTKEVIEEKFVKDITVFSKLEKLKDAKRASDTSAAKMPLKTDESITNLDKRALALLYKGIDSNFYQPTVDDIFSKHDLAIQDSMSEDVAILDHSLVDLESIDFSIDSKGKVVVSKLNPDQPSPISTRGSDISKQMTSYVKDGRYTSSSPGRISSVKWVGEGQKEEGLVSQLGNENDSNRADKNYKPSNPELTREVFDDKAVENITEFHELDKLEDVVRSGREIDTSAVKITLKTDDSIIDIDEQALASLYRDIDSNFYKPTVDDIFSRHDLAIQNSNSLQDVDILDHSLVDLESIDFSIDSKGKVVVSKHGTDQQLPLSTQKVDASKQGKNYEKDGRLVTSTGRTASAIWLGESQKEGERLVTLVDNNIDFNNLKPTGQVGDEKALDNLTSSNISQTIVDTASVAKTKMNKYQESLKTEILNINLNNNDNSLEIHSNVSLEEKEVWTSNTEEIPKNLIPDKLKTETVKDDENQKPLPSKISRSVSDEKLSRISEEDYVEQDTSKPDTLAEESKEIRLKEKNDAVISDQFEDCKNYFHDSEKSLVNNEEISQKDQKYVENTNDIKQVSLKSLVSKETENLHTISSNLKINDEHVKQAQSTRSKNYTQHGKDINKINNKSIAEMRESQKMLQSANTSKINQKHENEARIENIVNDFIKDDFETNDEQNKPIEMVESKNKLSLNPEVDRSIFVTHENMIIKEDNIQGDNKIQDIVSQGQIMNDINITNSLAENNVNETYYKKRESYDLKMTQETQAIKENIEKPSNSNVGENKSLTIKDLEHTTKIEEHQRDSKSSVKIQATKASQDKHHMEENTDKQDTVEHGYERESKNSETVEQTKRISLDIHTSQTNNVKGVDKKEENDGNYTSLGGIMSTDPENKIYSKSYETAEQSIINGQSTTGDKGNNKPDIYSDEVIKSEQETKKDSNIYIKISEHLKSHSQEDTQHHKPEKIYSRETQDSRRNSSHIENKKSESQNYQENKIINKDNQGKQSIHNENEQDNERVSKDSQSKDDSSNKPLKIHSRELHGSKREISNIENTKGVNQIYQEDKIISKDSQGKESIKTESDIDITHEKPLKLQNSSEIIKKDQDYEKVSKEDGNSKEDGHSKKDSQSKGVSDSESAHKDTQQKSETESTSSNIPVLPERCNLCGTYHKKQD